VRPPEYKLSSPVPRIGLLISTQVTVLPPPHLQTEGTGKHLRRQQSGVGLHLGSSEDLLVAHGSLKFYTF
jgi:hypothetical protein